MNQIPIYDTISGNWSWMITQGDSMENRSDHSAVLTPDERIIIFGGFNSDVTIVNQLIVLDTNINPYKWFVPNTTTIIPALSFHSATLVGNYMLVNFGSLKGNSTTPFFYILDIRNYTWVTQFKPDNGKNIGVIIGIVCGCVGVSAIIGLLVRKIYKSCNRQKHQHQRNIPHDCERPVRSDL